MKKLYLVIAVLISCLFYSGFVISKKNELIKLQCNVINLQDELIEITESNSKIQEQIIDLLNKP